MVDDARKPKQSPQPQAPDIGALADAIRENSLVVAEAMAMHLETAQKPAPQQNVNPVRRWRFKIERDSAGDVKQIIAEAE